MKKQTITQTKKHRIDAEFVSFLTWMAALLLFTLIIAMAANGAEDNPEIPLEEFPNAIRITADDLNTYMTGNDPYGILNFLSLQTGLTFRSTGDFGAEDSFVFIGE